MTKDKKMRSLGAGLLAMTLAGSLAAGPHAARADDPPPKDKSAGKDNSAGKPGKKQDNIPIKIVPPIIVPDKGKDAPKPGK